MRCIFCGSEQSSVIDKRGVRSTGEIRRRRECLKCHERFTTYERVSAFELNVLKRDGSKEAFDKNKIRSGLAKALEKRPQFENLEEIVEKVIARLKLKGKKEIESKAIGRAVLNELKKRDQVAYLRFASVYRDFKHLEDFEKELKSLNV